MTIEGVMSDAKYRFRAFRTWLCDVFGMSGYRPGLAQHAVCEHRVLVAHLCDPVQETPCADCGELVNLSSFAFKYGCFYIVAADK